MACKERYSWFLICLLGVFLLIGAAAGTDTGIWIDEVVSNTITQTNPGFRVCVGVNCSANAYQFTVTTNASVAGSPICTPANDECNTNGSSSLVYGELWLHTESADGLSTSLNTTDYTTITGFTGGDLNGVDNASNSLTIVTTGVYLINWHAGFASSANSRLFEITVCQNGNELGDCENHREIANLNDQGSSAGTCINNLNAEDSLTLCGEVDAAADIKMYGGNLNIVLIGQ